MFSRILCLSAAAILVAVPARAQIYAWHDANGTLVLSDRKTDPSAITYEVPNGGGVRVTRPAASLNAARPYEAMIQEHAAHYSIDPALVRAVIQVESGFNPRARSPKGAMGLMQLMPQTARDMSVVHAYDPYENIRGGTGYLRQLLDRYNGNEQLALAAYNAGPEAVNRYGQRVPPFAETRDYVKRVGVAASSTTKAPKRVIYKTIDIVDGHPVVRYSTEKPATGSYEIVGQ
jgi:soluble lytic murein transglycosylase-like protein